MAKKSNRVITPSAGAATGASTATNKPIITTTNTTPAAPPAVPAVAVKLPSSSSSSSSGKSSGPQSWDKVVANLTNHYQTATPQRTKLLDAFMAFLVVVGGLQFLYCILAGNYVRFLPP
jgi:oligosaccharyltransferase complex subunit epsilon